MHGSPCGLVPSRAWTMHWLGFAFIMYTDESLQDAGLKMGCVCGGGGAQILRSGRLHFVVLGATGY